MRCTPIPPGPESGGRTVFIVPPVPPGSQKWQRLRPCRALQKSPLFVRWRHSGIFRASGCFSFSKFYTAYCSSSHHENILCNFGTNFHFCVIFNCCEARTVNCSRAIEHRNEIGKCFLSVLEFGESFKIMHCRSLFTLLVMTVASSVRPARIKRFFRLSIALTAGVT